MISGRNIFPVKSPLAIAGLVFKRGRWKLKVV